MKLHYGPPAALLALVLGGVACDGESVSCDARCEPTSSGGAGGEGGDPIAQAGSGGEEVGSGGEQSAGNGGAGGDSTGEVTGPRVIAISPEDGADGVTRDAPIVVTFSEPMDPASTEDAFSAPDLDGNITFEWDDSGTIMTVTPDEPLEYASGPDESHAAREYVISVLESAENLEGEPLLERFDSSFETLRAVELSLAPEQVGSAASSSSINFDKCYVGDDNSNVTFRCDASFSLESVPEGRQLDRALFRAYVVGSSGAPFDGLGGLMVDQMEPVAPPAPFAAEALSNLAAITTAPEAGTWLAVDVTEGVEDDLANRSERGDRTLLRLRFENTSDEDSLVDFLTLGTVVDPEDGPQDQALELTYLVP